MSDFGVLSVLPPLIAVILAIVTRKAVLSLFLGVWSGAIIYTGSLGISQTFDWIIGAIADDFHAQIIVFTLLLGSGTALIWRMGGSYAVRSWALKRLDNKRKVGLTTWALGIAMFFDDYANTAIVGSTMKDVSDELRISREKLSYIVDSTAAPIATLFISSWVAFQLGMIEDGYEAAGVSDPPGAVEVFIQSIPFNMYAVLALVMVGIIVISGRDYGEMLTAEKRASTTGKVNRDDARPMQDVSAELGDPYADTPRLLAFVVPIVVLIVVTIGSALWTGYDPGASATDMVIEADYAIALVFGSFAMVVSSFVIGFVYDILSLDESVDTTIAGFGIMLTAVSILVLAWSIGSVVNALGTGDYIAGFAEGTVPAELLPVLVFLLAGAIAFSTGSAWSTMGIVTPIAIPVAWNLTGDHTMIAAMIGTIFSGSVFGDHSSPISDTSVMSATFTGADLIDHVRTQVYYAFTVAFVVSFLLITWGYTEVTPLLLLPIGVVMLTVLVYILSGYDGHRRGISPEQEYTEFSEDQ